MTQYFLMSANNESHANTLLQQFATFLAGQDGEDLSIEEIFPDYYGVFYKPAAKEHDFAEFSQRFKQGYIATRDQYATISEFSGAYDEAIHECFMTLPDSYHDDVSDESSHLPSSPVNISNEELIEIYTPRWSDPVLYHTTDDELYVELSAEEKVVPRLIAAVNAGDPNAKVVEYDNHIYFGLSWVQNIETQAERKREWKDLESVMKQPLQQGLAHKTEKVEFYTVGL